LKNIFENIETPCLIIDVEKVRKNLGNMQDIADKYNCSLRPHIKTHKSVELAKLQLAFGAKGITCAKISEAEVMFRGGIRDIFIAYPLIGVKRIQSAVALNSVLERLILAVDSYEGARELSNAAVNANTVFDVRLEVDTGLRRTGVAREEAIRLAELINRLPGLNLTGIFTFKCLVLEGNPTTDAQRAGQEEGLLLNDMVHAIRNAGIDMKDISAGSTPTAEPVAKTGAVNEIRPGTYIFYDYMMYKEGACRYEDIAAFMLATVVSTPAKDYAVIDGGSKTFSTDTALNTAPYFYPGYAVIEGREDLLQGYK
jgi:D-serine deaminase-like pyridoxal phosphate-dependent protein